MICDQTKILCTLAYHSAEIGGFEGKLGFLQLFFGLDSNQEKDSGRQWYDRETRGVRGALVNDLKNYDEKVLIQGVKWSHYYSVLSLIKNVFWLLFFIWKAAGLYNCRINIVEFKVQDEDVLE